MSETKYHQAVGMLTTICPDMQIDPDDPLGMAEKILTEVKRLQADLVITVDALKIMANGHVFLDAESADRWIRSVAGSALEEISPEGGG